MVVAANAEIAALRAERASLEGRIDRLRAERDDAVTRSVMMKVWTNNKFHGRYPVGTAAVVVADTAGQAAELLAAELKQTGLLVTVTEDQFEQLPTDRNSVRVLCDGNY